MSSLTFKKEAKNVKKKTYKSFDFSKPSERVRILSKITGDPTVGFRRSQKESRSMQ